MAVRDNSTIVVTLTVMVHVDPTDDELLDRFDRTNGPFSVADIVRTEVQSNLESVSYVRRVTVTTKAKGGEV